MNKYEIIINKMFYVLLYWPRYSDHSIVIDFGKIIFNASFYSFMEF